MNLNGLLKDAINNRSIRTPVMRFSHDRASNGTDDVNGNDKPNAHNSMTSATEKSDSANEEVRNKFIVCHTGSTKNAYKLSEISTSILLKKKYRFQHRQTIAVCPVVQIVFGFNMLMSYRQRCAMEPTWQKILL